MLDNIVDIAITDDFDFILDKDNDITDCDCFKQQIIIRIKTMNPDWFYDELGSDLEQLLGMPNKKETALKGVQLIRRCLTYDGFVNNDNIFIKPVPANENTISFFVAIKTNIETIIFSTDISLSGGINIREVK